jgi:hypothetical protein
MRLAAQPAAGFRPAGTRPASGRQVPAAPLRRGPRIPMPQARPPNGRLMKQPPQPARKQRHSLGVEPRHAMCSGWLWCAVHGPDSSSGQGAGWVFLNTGRGRLDGPLSVQDTSPHSAPLRSSFPRNISGYPQRSAVPSARLPGLSRLVSQPAARQLLLGASKGRDHGLIAPGRRYLRSSPAGYNVVAGRRRAKIIFTGIEPSGAG